MLRLGNARGKAVPFRSVFIPLIMENKSNLLGRKDTWHWKGDKGQKERGRECKKGGRNGRSERMTF